MAASRSAWLVNAVFPAGELQKEVMDRARRLAGGPSVAFRYPDSFGLRRAQTFGEVVPFFRLWPGQPDGCAPVRRSLGSRLQVTEIVVRLRIVWNSRQ